MAGKNNEYVLTPEARAIVREMGYVITLPTLISWCKKFNIGKLIGGRWYVHKVKLVRFVEGEKYALPEKQPKSSDSN